MIPAFLAKFAFGRWLSRIPRKVWIIVAVVAAVLFAGFVLHRIHDRKIKELIETSYNEGRDDAYAAIEAQTKIVEQKSAVIAADIRSKTNEENRAIAERADDVRVRGPGKATYQCEPVAARSTGGRVASSGQADAPVAAVPDNAGPVLAVVPFAELTAFAEQHDLNRSEVIAWRENRTKQLELLGSTNK